MKQHYPSRSILGYNTVIILKKIVSTILRRVGCGVKMYIIEEKKVWPYLFTCSQTYIKINLIIYKGICLNRMSIRWIWRYLPEDRFDHRI
jgi:hypothetical protein